jgi:formylglycine-generating enzyme required for sulfatase activity
MKKIEFLQVPISKLNSGITKMKFLDLILYILLVLVSTALTSTAFAIEPHSNKDREIGNQDMVFIKGDCYQMGDTFGDGKDDEKPVHEVCVDDFYLGKYELTQREWKEVMGNNMASFYDCGDDCPADNVSWNNVQEFIRRLNVKTSMNYRLPTEAEWEYAAREGGENLRFPTGKNIIGPDEANFNGSSKYKKPYSRPGIYRTKTISAKSFLPNSLGLYNMSGNVWEWVQDWYDKNYYQNSPRNNPKGPGSGEYRVLRGGSWGNLSNNLRAAKRHRDRPDSHRRMLYGFRLARDK